jgi:hypothetical protein
LGSISTGENKLGKVTIGKNGVAYNNSQVVRGRVLADDPSINDQMNDLNHYREEPLQKHCCADSGIQSKLIFTSEKTNGHQQLSHSANS